MISSRQLGRLNDHLGAELGRNLKGEPKYSWRWSEDLTHSMREIKHYDHIYHPATGEVMKTIPVFKYDYVADPVTGIIAAQPIFIKRKMAPHLNRQWVLCVRSEPPSERDWNLRMRHPETGDLLLEYPKGGYFFPLNVELEHGTDPDLNITLCAIDLFRKQGKKDKAELINEAEKAEEYREKSRLNEMSDRISSACTAFANLPGDHGGQVEIQIGRNAAMAQDDVFTNKETVN